MIPNNVLFIFTSFLWTQVMFFLSLLLSYDPKWCSGADLDARRHTLGRTTLVGGIWAAPSLLSLERSWGRSPRCRPSNTPKFIFWSCFSFKQIFASKIFFSKVCNSTSIMEIFKWYVLEKMSAKFFLIGTYLTTSHTHDRYKLCETLCGATTHLRTTVGLLSCAQGHRF